MKLGSRRRGGGAGQMILHDRAIEETAFWPLLASGAKGELRIPPDPDMGGTKSVVQFHVLLMQDRLVRNIDVTLKSVSK
jgi:hypothetical protein